MKTPDEEVATRIVERLRAANLVSEDKAKKLLAALASGKLKAEDWTLAIEEGPSAQGGQDGSKG